MDESVFTVIISDTGSQLHWFPNAQGFWADYTGEEYTTHIIDEDGEQQSFYCGKIVYAAPTDSDSIPTPEELIEKHNNPLSDRTGEQEWGREL